MAADFGVFLHCIGRLIFPALFLGIARKEETMMQEAPSRDDQPEGLWEKPKSNETSQA